MHNLQTFRGLASLFAVARHSTLVKKCKISRAMVELVACGACGGSQTVGFRAFDVAGFGAFGVSVSDISEPSLSPCKSNPSPLEIGSS